MSTMDEHVLASQVEEMKDDPEAWGEPDTKTNGLRKSERRQRGAVVSVRLTVDELATVQEYASARGLTVSGYLRTAALEPASRTVVSPRWIGAVATNSSLTDPRQIVYIEEVVAQAG